MKKEITQTLIAPFKMVCITLMMLLTFTSYGQRPAGSVPSDSSPKQLALGTANQSTHPNAASTNKTSRVGAHLQALSQKGELSETDTEFVITSEHTSSLSGVHHIYYRQALNGIEISGTEASIHITSQGKIAITHDNNLIKDLSGSLKSSAAALTAPQAIQAVASQMNYGSVNGLQEITTTKQINGTTLYTNGGISGLEIPAKQLYYLVPNDGIRIIWAISIKELHSSDWWSFRVDATTGMIIDKYNLTVSCNILDGHEHSEHDSIAETNDCDDTANYSIFSNSKATMAATVAADGASYNVYALPIESPYFGTRTLVVDPADPTASPFGWHDTNGVTGAESTTTSGNNTITVDDIANNDNGGTSPNGGASLVFDFPFDATQTQAGIPNIPLFETNNRSLNAAITNTFYWTNIIHDISYYYGFDEASGNFQANNYGNGGIAGDPVLGDVQDGFSTCNAFFSTPPDGTDPRMEMFTCADNDGAYDNLVIIHEYAHGISTRLTGGANNVGSLNNQEQQGEGWSDYYGYMYTMSSSNFSDDRPVGTFLINQGPNGAGIRSFPYSGNMATNSQDYQDLINIGDGASAPHPIGEIWASMLYDLTQDLIAEYGFDPNLYTGTGGNNISLALVTEGLKLQPSSPGFVDSRDAILQADQILYGGANQCIIWESFAARGLGFSADQGSSNSRADGTAAFDVPPITLEVTTNDFCTLNEPETVSGGLIGGGTYSGPGVTDDGNGATFTFDPSAAGSGTHTITYSAVDCNGDMDTDTDTITVTEILPEISGCLDVTLALDADGTVAYDPFAGDGLQVDIVGSNNSGNTPGGPGFSVLQVAVAQNVTVSFDWAHTTTDLAGFDDTGYVINDTFFPLSDASATTQNGSETISLSNGDTFGFAVSTDDNSFGEASATFTNFSPGYSGQFATSNWTEILENSDGSAAFSGSSTPNLISCGEITTSLSQEIFTCLDIGTTTEVIVTVIDSQGNEDTCTANVTITGGAINTTTFIGGAWNNGDPTGTSLAVINDDYDSATMGNINACSCEINAGQTATIRDGNFMNIAGNITVDGTLIVENEGSVVQIDENAITINNGTIEINKTTPEINGRGFVVLSSPMSAETRNGVFQSANRVFEIRPEDFTPHPDITTAINFTDVDFDYFAPPTALEIGRGYLVFPQAVQATTAVALDHTYTQGTLNSGTIAYPLEYNGPTTENNFNVAGNPYASAIDTDMLIATNDAIDQVYFWEHLTDPSADNPGDNTINHSMDDISIYNLTGGIAAVNGGTAPGRYMVSGQGFGVLANQSELETPLSFTNAMRVVDNNGTVRNAENDVINRLWLRLSDKDETTASTALIGFLPEATPDYDSGYDAKRIASTVSLYSQDLNEVQLSIQGRETFSSDITIGLGFESKLEGHTDFIISIDQLEGQELNDTDVFLKDNLLDITVNLKEEDYVFTASPSDNPERFTLSFEPETTLTVNDNVNLDNQLTLYPNPSNGLITLSYNGNKSLQQAVVMDVNGKLIKRVDLTTFQDNHNFDLSALAIGMYFIQIEIEDTVVTKKILIK